MITATRGSERKIAQRRKNLLEALEEFSREKFFEAALCNLPDASFLLDLKRRRKNGRNDYPLSILWKGLLASIAYKIPSIEELRRRRDSSPFLQKLFPVFPPSSSFSRFFSLLDPLPVSLEQLHTDLLKTFSQRIDKGPSLAIGLFQNTHILWEPSSGLPLLLEPAVPQESHASGALRLLAKLKAKAPFLLDCAKYLLADSSYEPLIESAWDTFQLKPIIPLQDPTPSTHFFRHISYDRQGTVYCKRGDPTTSHPMVFAGFEKSRNSLKYRCVANHYGILCNKKEGCPLWRSIRIALTVDRKIFTPLPRSSYRWHSLFNAYNTKEALQQALLPLSSRRQNLRLRLYVILLLSAGAHIPKW